MRLSKFLIFFQAGFSALFLPLQSNKAQQLTTERLQVSVSKYSRGTSVDLILTFRPIPGYHLYWWNSGDTGQPIDFYVQFDKEPSKMYPILLSPPQKLKKSIITDYVLKGEFVALLSFDFLAPPERVRIKLDYLICEEVCVPETVEGNFTLNDLTDQSSVNLIQQLSFPSQLSEEISVLENESTTFKVPHGSIYFFPIGLTPDQIIEIDRGVVVAGRFRNLKGLLAWEKDHSTQYFQIGQWGFYPKVEEYHRTWSSGLLLSVGLAVLSGLVLNFMPCVLPVLALKAVRTVTAKTITEDVGYLLGVTVTILSLGMFTAGIFASAVELGWGFQFQNPYFVAAVNFALIAAVLGFFGLIRIPTMVSNPVETKNKLLNQFALGVFITLIAVPCGAPFLVPLLATTGQRSGLENFITFTAMGISFGGFYILVERSKPFAALLKIIQRNYSVAKTVLSIPIFGTIFWLLYINEKQGLVITFLLVTYVLILAGIHLFQNGWRVFGVMVIIVGVYFFGYTTPSTEYEQVENGVVWQNYSEQLIQNLQSQGKKYYLDFTADWCVTCKLNKFVVFSDRSLVEDLKKAGFIFVKADWTNRSEEISAALKKRGQKAIPVTVIYTPEKGEVILPTILLPSIVRTYALE